MLYIDIDGVIADLASSIITYIKSELDIDLEFGLHNWDSYDALNQICDVKVLIKDYIQSEYPNNIKMIQDASEVINTLQYDITLLTARPIEAKVITISWLNKHNIPYDKLIFRKDKAKYLIRNDVDCLIEDNPKTALDVAKLGIPVLLYDALYNRNVKHKNIIRVKDWKEIEAIL